MDLYGDNQLSKNIINFPGLDPENSDMVFEPASDFILEMAKENCRGKVLVIGLKEEDTSAVLDDFELSTNMSLEEMLFLLKRAENAITRIE